MVVRSNFRVFGGKAGVGVVNGHAYWDGVFSHGLGRFQAFSSIDMDFSSHHVSFFSSGELS